MTFLSDFIGTPAYPRSGVRFRCYHTSIALLHTLRGFLEPLKHAFDDASTTTVTGRLIHCFDKILDQPKARLFGSWLVAGCLILSTGCERIAAELEFTQLCEEQAGVEILYQTDESIDQYRDENGEIDWHALSEFTESEAEHRSEQKITGGTVRRYENLWTYKGIPAVKQVKLTLWIDNTIVSGPLDVCPDISVNQIRSMMFKEQNP